MANNLLLILLVIIVVFVLYYYIFDGTYKLCPNCGRKTAPNGDCPNCPVVSSEDAQQVLQSLALGCTHRLRGVVREDVASASEVSDFMTSGTNKLVIITNVDPEDFVRIIYSGQDLKQLSAVAMSSSVVRGQKNYIVMALSNGNLSPMGSPTQNFVDAFQYLESAARKLGPDSGNLVFYIDEDIECPPEEVTALPMEESMAMEESMRESMAMEESMRESMAMEESMRESMAMEESMRESMAMEESMRESMAIDNEESCCGRYF